jgi:DNA invertase Pin-like site-specific DNA recombinase
MPSPFPTGALIAAYLRDSGGEDQDLSVPQQEAALKAWCSDNALSLTRIFRDIATPGSTTIGRTAFNDMIAYFRGGSIPEAGILIWKYSRFARDIDDAQFYKADLRRRNFIIHSLNDTIPEGLNGRFFEAAIDWMNARFLEDLSTDVKRGVHHLFETTGALGGTPPRGFKREPINLGDRRDGQPHIVHRWVPDPAMIATIQKAFELRSAGSSYGQIHRETRLYGSINSYTTFFSNPIYKGELHFADKIITDYCEPIVDPTIWDQVQDLNQARGQTGSRTESSTKNHPRRAGSSFILSGIARCARCGSPLNGQVIKSSKGYTNNYYQCSRHTRRRDCDAPKIPKSEFELIVIRSLKDHLLSPANLSLVQKSLEDEYRDLVANGSVVRQELVDRHELTQRQIGNVTSALAETGPSPALTSKLKDLEHQEHDLANRIHAIDLSVKNPPVKVSQDQLITLSQGMIKKLTEADPGELRVALTNLVESIIIDRQGKVISGYITFYTPDDFMSMGQCPQRETLHRHKKIIVRFSYPPDSVSP